MSLPPLSVIPAGAGSGKTFAIQKRLAKWVSEGLVAPEKIAAVTYTEAAASELRERIRGELVGLGRLEDALCLDRAYISTIHGFGMRLLTEFTFELGFTPAPRLLSEEEANLLVGVELAGTEALDEIMRRLPQYGYTYRHSDGETAEESLRGRVRGAIGKLREVGRASGEAGEAGPLGNAAEAFLRERYGPTGDAAQLEQRLRAAVEALLERFPDSLAPQFAEKTSVAEAFRKDHRALGAARRDDTLSRDWRTWNQLSRLRQSKRGSETPDGYDALAERVTEAASQLPHHPGPLEDEIRHARVLVESASDSLARYAAARRRRGLVDYTDMIAEPWQLLAERPDVVQELRERIDCLVIDEFQDTNPLQFALLWRLHLAGIPTLVVGDVKQAIMGFQGADPRLFDQLPRHFPDATEPLAANWRSSEKLMAFLNRAGEGLFGEDYIHLEPRAGFESRLGALELIEAGGTKVGVAQDALLAEGVARIRALLDDESALVWDRAQQRHRRLCGGDIAVLAPRHSVLDKFANALRSAGIRVRREEKGWQASPAVRLACQALAHVADPADGYAALAVAVTELGETELEPALRRLLAHEPLDDPAICALAPVAGGDPERSVPALLEEVCSALDLWQCLARWPDAAGARADLLRLHAEAAHFHDASPEALASAGIHGAGPKSFLAWLPHHAKGDLDRRPEPRVCDEEAVVLATWFAAKGREWPVVLVAGLDVKVEANLPDLAVRFEDFADLDRVLDRASLEISPSFHARETKERFEAPLREREQSGAHRLLYVALTRARETLILQWPEYLREKLKRNETEPTTYWSILRDAVGLELMPEGLAAGDHEFPARVTHAEPGGEAPDGAEAAPPLPVLGRRALERREAPAPESLTPDQVAPSTLEETSAPLPSGVRTEAYAPAFEVELPVSAAERGELLHRAFEILYHHPERRPLLARATGVELTEPALDAICAAVHRFEEWVSGTLGATAVRMEVPFLAPDERGSVVHGIIDMLIETPQGLWVIDHKSDRVEDLDERMRKYWPQLHSYAAAVESVQGNRVRGVGVNWIGRGEVSVVEVGSREMGTSSTG